MTHDQTVALFAGSVIAAIVAGIVYLANRRSNEIRATLLPIVTAAGWAGAERKRFATAVKGVWHSLPAQIAFHARQKSVPARLILMLRAPGVSRLIVQRRTKYLFHNRPLAWFGPPLIDVHHPAGQELWVRSDEPAFAERVFGDEKLVSMISRNLTDAFDEVRVDRKGVRITRALPNTANAFRIDATVIETTARDEVAIAEALLRKVT